MRLFAFLLPSMPAPLFEQPAFRESLIALPETAETEAAVRELIMRVQQSPLNAPPIPGTELRMIEGEAVGTFPALRLFYSIVEEGVELWRVDRAF